jgi:hypothetical protein
MDKHDYWGWLEERDLYWLAGLLEGEGYFKAGVPSAPNKPRIVVSMTDEDVVRKVAELWSVSYHRLNRSKKKEGHSPAYQVMLTHRPAIELMKKVYPLMGARRQQQIDKVLASYQPPARMRARRTRKKVSE